MECKVCAENYMLGNGMCFPQVKGCTSVDAWGNCMRCGCASYQNDALNRFVTEDSMKGYYAQLGLSLPPSMTVPVTPAVAATVVATATPIAALPKEVQHLVEDFIKGESHGEVTASMVDNVVAPVPAAVIQAAVAAAPVATAQSMKFPCPTDSRWGQAHDKIQDRYMDEDSNSWTCRPRIDNCTTHHANGKTCLKCAEGYTANLDWTVCLGYGVDGTLNVASATLDAAGKTIQSWISPTIQEERFKKNDKRSHVIKHKNDVPNNKKFISKKHKNYLSKHKKITAKIDFKNKKKEDIKKDSKNKKEVHVKK